MEHLYTYTVPLFIKMLGGLKNCLEKTATFAREKGIPEADILQDRLAPDMFPLVKQVQIATDNAKGAAARLSGTDIPKYEDTETTIAELIARIEKTLAFIQSVPESAFEKAADVQVTLPYFPGKFMTGFDYAREYALPNFFFHTVTAYGLMRKRGVEIGKADYVFSLPLRDL